MVRSIFGIITVGMLCVSSLAHAACLDTRGNEFRPFATADQNGVVVVRTPTGQPLQVSGLAPGQDWCKALLFKSASRKCAATGKAHLAELRDPKFCKRGSQEGRTCVHIVCD